MIGFKEMFDFDIKQDKGNNSLVAEVKLKRNYRRAIKKIMKVLRKLGKVLNKLPKEMKALVLDAIKTIEIDE